MVNQMKNDQVGIQSQKNLIQDLKRVKQDTRAYELYGIDPQNQKNLLELGMMIRRNLGKPTMKNQKRVFQNQASKRR